ncbi:DEAD/DEAH box helicase [Candidatus Peribacteria bacterium RIFCSPHIGHO2_02_FULL_52_16]|nr:MAG: DEAD/DEAH box helicase [Candidatus Peribacteria bacterium RIFCSPHIGHO2_01_FULL_51_35]OGJ60858.1 MAG: DEAD/DEAH box helicase [Candidatus Peribacteria bacterium RIFCSPHIGHO2_02_FULL_52_16]HLB59288.1 SNF2-related protein [Bdellovibrionota bacterium]
MKLTDYHAKYFAYELTKRSSSDSLEKLTATLSNAQVDLNPHQIEAALFAFRSPLSKGAILADEVGLGKTIEAGLVISQKWAERKRKILLIVPSNLRKQWNAELQEKFFIPSSILEAKSFNQLIKEGNLNPLNQEDTVVICSYHFARNKSPYVKQTPWDLVVIDEAHRLRNVYKPSNKIAKEIKESLDGVPKILLTATPLQNSLLELYGLVSIIDDHVFGDLKSFKSNYAKVSQVQDINENELGLIEPKQEMFVDLRNRLKTVCIRTLRRQVLEYIKYTKRIPLTQDYIPSEEEIELYNEMTEYLQRPKLYALPASQRHLMSLILRKLLASSSFAIASTLDGLATKIKILIEDAKKKNVQKELGIPNIEENFDTYEELADEWIDEEEDDGEDKENEIKVFTEEDIVAMKKERVDLQRYRDIAKRIWKNSKGDALLIGLKKGFQMTEELGAQKKAIIFTESRITQNYLLDLLSENGYEDKVVFFNGSNNDPKSKEIYAEWLRNHKDTDKVTGSKTADMRAAIVDHFKNEAEIMIATEAGAEGINLQFCSLVINYDLPWNPQRIEQRIGRCHRYGQKYDVVVINFVNRKNAADQRVYELLDQKFNLFKGVFGASDEVLGSIESGVDFEKRIASIYQSCRSEEEINTAFDTLQREMDESIQENMGDAKQKLLENFDAEVHEKLKFNLHESKQYLDKYDRWLWDTTKYFLGNNAEYSDNEYSFVLNKNPFKGESIPPGPYKIGKNVEDSHIYRPGHPLAERILESVKATELPEAEVTFEYSGNPVKISVLEPYIGKSGVIRVVCYTVQAFESEDHIITIAIDEDGEVLDPEVSKKIFSLSGSGKKCESPSAEDLERLRKAEDQTVTLISGQIAERNSDFFDVEVEKLDKWAEDVKKALELDLKKLDIDIKTAKTASKKILNLDEKLQVQKSIKDMEKKRNDMRKKLFESQDEVEEKKEGLIERVEAQLKQNATLEPLFTIRWRVI